MIILGPSLACFFFVSLLTKAGNVRAFAFLQQHKSVQKVDSGVLSRSLVRNGGGGTTTRLFGGFSARVQNRDVVIVGGGLAGLSAALYLTQIAPERHVTILEREDPSQLATAAASFAAAGMLAPQSERLPSGPLLDLCLESRRLYREFVELVESMASESGVEGEKYLTYGDGTVGYVGSGGFLAPAFAGDSVEDWAPPEGSGSALWLDSDQVRELEPYLHPDVVGGWWFPDDASVDARQLTCSLRAACVGAGVQILTGASYEVTALDLVGGKCNGLWLESGKYLKTESVLVANGSWMRGLLPVPIEPHKGQSISLRMPSDRPPILRRVLFGQDTYIVPKQDGRLVIGATVEAGSYDSNVTPAGLMHILHYAIRLVPALANLPLEETWAGLRPTTPDKGPILGKTPWENLFLAGGYWRNGVLLAPKTGQLLANLLSGQALSQADEALLRAFAWDRFTSPGGGKAMAVQARYAASMHPVHNRAEGPGISAAVGSELGAYSTAPMATAERAREREIMFDKSDGSLERAAALGKSDSEVFEWDEEKSDGSLEQTTSLVKSDSEVFEWEETTSLVGEQEKTSESLYEVYGKIKDKKDLLTKEEEESLESAAAAGKVDIDDFVWDDDFVDPKEDDLSSVYDKIQSNKALDVEMAEDEEEEERPDPGFRIWFVDQETKEPFLVPPYTTPDEMTMRVAKIKQERAAQNGTIVQEETPEETPAASEAKIEDTGDSIFDGYTALQEEAARDTLEEEREVMREARLNNRFFDEIDTSQIGVHPPEEILS